MEVRFPVAVQGRGLLLQHAHVHRLEVGHGESGDDARRRVRDDPHRAYGTFATRIADAKAFFQNIVGTQGLTGTEEILGQLRSTILSKLSDAIAEAKIAALDLAANYNELSAAGTRVLQPEFSGYGLELSRFFIENISLPEEVEAAIDQRTKLGVLGDKMQQYAQLQTADAIRIAAANPGGIAGAGVGIGAGIAIGNTMGRRSAPRPLRPPHPHPRRRSKCGGAMVGRHRRQDVRPVHGRRPARDGEVGTDCSDCNAWHPGAPGWAPLASYTDLDLGLTPPPPPPK